MDQKIKQFWEDRAKRDEFLWQDLAELNSELTNRHLSPGAKVLDLGCGDGRSTKHLKHPAELTLVDYVRPIGLTLPPNCNFIQEDIRKFQTDERFDLITLYGVANSFDIPDISRIYHMCYGWLKPGGKLLVKHQCGKNEDIIIDKFSESLGANYSAYYHSVANHTKMLRRAGFEPDVIDPYPLDKNKWENTVFKAFVCTRNEPMSYKEYFQKEHFCSASTPPRNGEVKKEFLKLLKHHLDAHDIPFYIMFGTLLGAVRDNDFIPWDADIDVAILGRFQNRLTKIMEHMDPIKLWRVGDFYCSFTFNGELMDLYTYTEEDRCYSYCGGHKRYFDEEKLKFDSPAMLKFKEMDLLTLNDPMSSLVRWYGEEWRIPNDKPWPDWCAYKERT